MKSIKFSVYLKNKFTKDDLIGYTIIPITKMIKNAQYQSRKVKFKSKN